MPPAEGPEIATRGDFVVHPVQSLTVRSCDSIGAPGRARTCDLLIRSQTLYPTELRVLRSKQHTANSRQQKSGSC
jgi:hypothetical protein